jgi:hypothetical protein
MGENFHLNNFLHLLLPWEVTTNDQETAINDEDLANNQTGVTENRPCSHSYEVSNMFKY